MKNLIPVILLLALTTGCASSSMFKQKPSFSSVFPGQPVKSLAAWEPAVKHSGLDKPQRGFGGRVYFYDEDGNNPVKVKGSVIVYAFDEENRKANDNAPTRSYFFAKDDVKKLYSKSKLGHSYNFWIPWDEEGPDGKAKKISLIVRYIPDKGSSVVSSQAVVYLPGKAGQNEMLAKEEWNKRNNNLTPQPAAGNSTIVQASYTEGGLKPLAPPKQVLPQEHLLEGNDNRPQTMKTTTISIPETLSTGLRDK